MIKKSEDQDSKNDIQEFDDIEQWHQLINSMTTKKIDDDCDLMEVIMELRKEMTWDENRVNF